MRQSPGANEKRASLITVVAITGVLRSGSESQVPVGNAIARRGGDEYKRITLSATGVVRHEPSGRSRVRVSGERYLDKERRNNLKASSETTVDR
jgi:hypothetical protein